MAGVYARTNSSAPILAQLGFERVGAAHYWRPRSQIPD